MAPRACRWCDHPLSDHLDGGPCFHSLDPDGLCTCDRYEAPPITNVMMDADGVIRVVRQAPDTGVS